MPETPPPIARAWESFSAAVMPGDAPEVQRREMRRAFYAGAWAMLQIVLGLDDDEAGLAALDLLIREGEGFARDVAGGRA